MRCTTSGCSERGAEMTGWSQSPGKKQHFRLLDLQTKNSGLEIVVPVQPFHLRTRIPVDDIALFILEIPGNNNEDVPFTDPDFLFYLALDPPHAGDAIEKMNFEEYQELYNFYLKLSGRYEEKRVMYKLAKLIEHREENEKKFGGHKSLDELDELLRKEDFP